MGNEESGKEPEKDEDIEQMAEEFADNLMKAMKDDEDFYGPMVRKIFDEYDANKNGFIEPKELNIMMKEFAVEMKCPKSKMKNYKELFLSLDVNKDGKISFDEFKKYGREMVNLIMEQSEKERKNGK